MVKVIRMGIPLHIKTVLLAALWVFFFAASPSWGQQSDVALVADTVQFDPNTGRLTARGNVKILHKGRVLVTEELTYDQATGRLHIPGPLMLDGGDKTIMHARNAVLDDDLRAGLIKGARFLINGQFQLAANEAHRQGNRYNVLYKAVGSTCFICEDTKTPFWQIRSRRVIHDHDEHQIYFENATLDFLGLPVMYLPNLRVPDPTLDRSTGVLVPRVISSTTLGYGIKIPYFWAINGHSDLTLTPFLTSKGGAVFEAQYRRAFDNGSLIIDGALLLGSGANVSSFSNYIAGKGHFQLSKDTILDFEVNASSNALFLDQYGYGDQDRLRSFIFVQRTRENSYLGLETSYIQSLRLSETDTQIPLVLPDVYYRHSWDEVLGADRVGLSLQTTSLLRENDQIFNRATVIADWRKNWQSTNGILLEAFGKFQFDGYYTHNDPDFGTGFIHRALPTAGVELRWPLMATTQNATHILEPVAQLIWSPDTQTPAPNEDSVQVEFEETNLFSYNRFPGFDKSELGFRVNVGVNYAREDISGWTFSTTVGRVYRSKDLSQFQTATGLSGLNSDYVGAVRLSLPGKFDLVNRTLFDDAFTLSKNETQATVFYRNLELSASYTYLVPDVVAGASEERTETTIGAKYRWGDYWSANASWRHNFNSGSPIEGAFNLTYENECVRINLSYSLDYTTSVIVQPTKEIGLTIALTGLGNKRPATRYARRCGV